MSVEALSDYQLQDEQPLGVLRLHHLQSPDLAQDLQVPWGSFFFSYLKCGYESSVTCDRWEGSVIALDIKGSQYDTLEPQQF